MAIRKTWPSLPVKTLEMYLVAVLLGGLAGWGYWWTTQKSAVTSARPTAVERLALSDAIATLNSSLPKRLAVRLGIQPQTYWVSITQQRENLVPQPLSWDPQASIDVNLTKALETLLSGSVKLENAFTAIPKNTTLLSLTTNADGIYVNLSREFAAGGGSSSMIYRVAQVVYTATSLDPEAKVYLSVAGQLIDEAYPLGGEGLILEQPVTRQSLAKTFSFSGSEQD